MRNNQEAFVVRYDISWFYIGITNDVDTRLFGQHRVNRDKQWWIFSPADNEEIARDVETHYLEFGMKG